MQHSASSLKLRRIAAPVLCALLLLVPLLATTAQTSRRLNVKARQTSAPSAPGTLQFSAATFNINENQLTATITVTRAGGSDGAVGVSYMSALSGNTARAGATCSFNVDYIPVSGTLSWNDGDSGSKSFNVTICDDNFYEGSESVHFDLNNPTGGATLGSPNSALLAIADDEPQPTISINDVSIAEGNVGTRAATFTVSITNPYGNNLNIEYSTADNTATAPSDYTAISSGIASIPMGSTSTTINVTIKGDTLFEQNETFFVNLSPAALPFTKSQGVGTIVNDDPTPGDFDNDGKTDVAIWNPSNGNWIARLTSTNQNVLITPDWGRSALGDISVPGDYDGDGKTDAAIFRQPEGNWYILKSSLGYTVPSVQNWGLNGDVPVAGDYDADGRTDLAVFRPSEGNWYILKSNNGSPVSTVRNWGLGTDKPVIGDFDGDAKRDIAVFRPSEGNWYIINSSTNTATVRNWGVSTDRLVPGDYDGDGRTDLGVYRAGTWFILKSTGGTTVTSWGDNSDVPVPGNYDGDNKTDIAVFRPSEGNWYVIQSGTNTGVVLNLGTTGNVPLPSAYQPQ